MKLVASLLLFIVSGCAVKTVTPQPPAAVAQTQPPKPPIAEPTPFKFPEMTQPESRRLHDLLPKDVRQVLEQSNELELFSIKSCIDGFSPDLKRIAPDKFQGCPILKRVAITDASLKSQLLEGLYYGIGSSPASSACFSPRHGIRAVHGVRRVELVICFQCNNYRGVADSGRIYGSISKAPEELFNRILSNGVER